MYKERNINNFQNKKIDHGNDGNGVYVSVSYSLILPWTHTCKLIERWHFSGTMWMMIKGILKSWCWISQYQGTFSILCSRIQCYILSLMNEVIRDFCFSYVFCMRCKTNFFNNWYQSGLQYHACITCNWVLELKKNSFLGVFIFCSKFFA